MSVYEKIRGIIGNIFAFDGGDGPILKNNAGVIEHRNTSDSGFVIARGDHPLAANDLVTKQYVDGAESGDITTIEIPFTFANAAGTVDSTFVAAVGGRVLNARVEISVAFDVLVTFIFGDTGDTDRFIVTGDVKVNKIDIYDFPQYTDSIASVFRITLGAGAPTVGTGRLIVEYCVPQA
jgi:hypothetical protein